MKPSMLAKLDQLANRLVELDELLGHEAATSNMDNYRKMTREHAELGPLVALYLTYSQAANDIVTAQELLSDPDMKEFAQEEINGAKARMEALEADLQKMLLPKDPNDERNIFLEIRAGTGGDESALFAGDLLRMYTRFAERNRWQVEMMSASDSEVGAQTSGKPPNSLTVCSSVLVTIFSMPRPASSSQPSMSRWYCARSWQAMRTR